MHYRHPQLHTGLPLLCLFLLLCTRSTNCYDIVRDYSGVTFFDRWDFYGYWDNLTLGDVWWLDRDSAFSQELAYVNNAGHVVLKVDNTTTVPPNEKRNSVRITTQDAYSVGSLWIIDLLHIPYGCSVWPAFWTMGPLWPNDGEIDIIEQCNLASANQMALHSTSGCVQGVPTWETGRSGGAQNTGINCSVAAGCAVEELQPNSYGDAFAAAGGGVWATQFDIAGVYMWFWSRPNVPPSISQASSTSSVDMGSWGPPSAAYVVSGCNVTEFFTPQNLVLDITLCGSWAGLPATYNPQCANAGPTGNCYADNVVGTGANYADAFFEISYVRAYTTGGPVPTPTQPAPGGILQNATVTASASVTSTAQANAARRAGPPGLGLGLGLGLGRRAAASKVDGGAGVWAGQAEGKVEGEGAASIGWTVVLVLLGWAVGIYMGTAGFRCGAATARVR